MSAAESAVGASSGSSAAVPSSLPPLRPLLLQQQQIIAAAVSSQQQQQGITVAQLSDAIREIIRHQEITPAARSRSDELRGWLMVVATLTASIKYGAALNPPGGVWQADDAAKGYIAGRPVLYDKFCRQFLAFYYCNVTSFVTSLCIIVLICTPSCYNRIRPGFFSNLVTMDLVALAAAFMAGSWIGNPYQLFYCIVLLLAILLLWHVSFKSLKARLHQLHIDQSV